MKNTGTLTCKRTKPKTHGPAFPVIFEWNTKCKNNEKSLVPMKISVDLCPALRVDWEVFNDSLQAIDCDISVYFKHNIQTVRSVLLMPNHRNLFKVTVTEAELLLTSDLSEHHIKCYKLLKYILNGEPFPLQSFTSKLKHGFQDKTILPSYSLKLMVWYHQFTQHCSEEIDLGSCFTMMLSRCNSYLQLEDILKHPMNSEVNVIGSKLSNHFGEPLGINITNTTLQSCERIRRVLKVMNTVQDVPVENYNFEKICHKIGVRGPGRYYRSKYTLTYTLIVCVLLVSQIACTGYFALSEHVWYSTVLWVVGSWACSGGVLGMNFFLSPNMLFRSSRDSTDTWIMCVVRVWYVFGLTLLTLSSHGLAFYLAVIIQGILLFALNLIRIYCIHKPLKHFMKTGAFPENTEASPSIPCAYA